MVFCEVRFLTTHEGEIGQRAKEKGKMRVQTRLTGMSPLVMHNIRLADPDDQFAESIAQITSKRKKTKDDRQEIAKLEFCGSLYVDDSGPYVPTANLRRCFKEAAKVRRLGTAVDRAVIITEQKLPLLYDGPRKVAELWDSPRFHCYLSVGINANRVMRMRPQFPAWELTAEWELLTEALNFDDFVAVVNAAGRVEGIGDGRRIGYGRFGVEVKEL